MIYFKKSELENLMQLFLMIHFPGIATRKVITFQIINPESDHFPDFVIRQVKTFRIINPESDHFPNVMIRKVTRKYHIFANNSANLQ